MQLKKAFLFLAVACATLTPQAYAASHTPQASISINQEQDTKTVFASGEIRQIASVEKRQFGSAEIRQFESIEKSQS